MKVLITSGGTKVPIDDVRFIGNMSSGKFGAALADEFDQRNIDVILWKAKGSVTPNGLYTACYNGRIDSAILDYTNYDEYLQVIDLAKVQKPDIIFSAAAVSDYIVDKTEGKISSSGDDLIITLKKATKVLPKLREACPKAMIVGFKLLVSPTYDEVYYAVQKVLNGGADYVVYNDLTEIREGNTKRLVFKKDMSFHITTDEKQLTQYILDEYSSRLDG
jgi:phosphopantothenoylcysteine decarboxylase/phosphopantothenate--cysteine ligase